MPPNHLPAYLYENADRIRNKPAQRLGKWNVAYDHPAFDSLGAVSELRTRYDGVLNRADVSALFAGQDYYLGFVAALIWGYVNATRPKVKGGGRRTTNFYRALSVAPGQVVDRLRRTEQMLLERDLGNAFRIFRRGQAFNIPGVDYPYYTKLFFFLGQANPEIRLKPLILDKWTQNGFAALLSQASPHLVPEYFRKIQFDGRVVQATPRSGRKLVDLYEQYTRSMNSWAVELGVEAAQVEEFIFGTDLRRDSSFTNPRKELGRVLVKYLEANERPES